MEIQSYCRLFCEEIVVTETVIEETEEETWEKEILNQKFEITS
jgi:hypothetical protein